MKIKSISSIFWRGFFTFIPIYLTLYCVYWLIKMIEGTFAGILEPILHAWYFPGLGILSSLLLIFLIGIIMQLDVGKYLIQQLIPWFSKLPIFGDLYKTISELTDYLKKTANKPKKKQTVMIKYFGAELMGVVTRDDFSDGKEKIVNSKDTIAVYLPMSYQLGGFTVYVKREKVRYIEMTAKEALKWSLISGVDKT